MFIPPIIILIIIILILRSIIVIISRNWFFIWLSIELNMLSFIPILLNNTKILEIEGSIKYFITQSIASSCILISSIIIWRYVSNIQFFRYLIIISILIKIGSFPCHFWFPIVISRTRWNICLLLSTWQKIIPIFITFSLLNVSSTLIIIVSIINIFIGGIFGINSYNIKSIIRYSSISHIGWILSIKILNLTINIYVYFFTYVIIITPIFIIFIKLNITITRNLELLNKYKFNILLIMSLIILSIAGLPPFTGFFLKLIVIYRLINFNIFYIIFLIVISVISLYFYLNICYNILLNSYINYNNITNIVKININTSILSILFLTPIILLIYAMIIFN